MENEQSVEDTNQSNSDFFKSYTDKGINPFDPDLGDDEDYWEDGPPIDREWEANYRAHSSSITGIYEGM